jgi:hypothetical protein
VGCDEVTRGDLQVVYARRYVDVNFRLAHSALTPSLLQVSFALSALLFAVVAFKRFHSTGTLASISEIILSTSISSACPS